MLTSRSLRWTGSGIGNGRHRLSKSLPPVRHFTHRTSARPSCPTTSFNTRNLNQTRSISLFGWGGSSPASSSSTTAATKQPEVEIGNSSLSEVRTFKASHATADTPDPLAPHHAVSAVEPQIVGKAEEAISFPAQHEQITSILDGEVDIASIPERLGYLKEVCGLDYGWGPTAFVEWALEHLHITGGLSWATSIILIAAITRIALVQPTVNAQRESAKLKELNPVIAPLRERINQYVKEGNRQKQMEVSAQMRSIYKEYDVKMTRIFLPLVIQLPIQFAAFRLLNAAGRLPVPAFVDEAWLWNHDLTFSDPYFITPALSAFFMWIQIKQQAKTQATGGPMSPAVTKLIGNVLPVMSFVFMTFQPGSVQLYFITTSLFALINGEALRQNGIRKLLSLPELTPTPAAPTTTPSTVTYSNTPAKVTPKPVTNGFQLRNKTVVVEESEPATPERSTIDKYVDKVKGKDWGSNWKEVTKTWQQTNEDKQRDRDEKYETGRRQQLEMEREMRNTAAREKSGRK